MLIRSFAGAAARLVFAALAMFAFSAAAEAQFLTFVSATGVDTRPCTVQAQPCKTLQRAVTVTGAGGTISILSDLGGGATINKSLTIDGGGNSMIGTINVNSASAVVTLRGLNMTGRGVVANGIRILSAKAVHIEDCTMERYTSDGIQVIATTATKLFISDTVSRANGSDGMYVDAVNAQAVIENSGFDQNFSSGVYLKVAKASVTGSSASGNGQHGFILLSGLVKITETAADYNSGSGFAVRASFNFLSSAEASGNGIAGLYIEAGPGVLAETSDCVFIGSATGVGVLNQGVWHTRENNSVSSYSGAAPTPTGAL